MATTSKLALYGGKPIRRDFLPYAKPTITEADKRAVIGCLDSGWIAGRGPKTRGFEEAICNYTGYRYAIAVNSATSGLRAAYDTLSVTSKINYTVPALTFVATINMLIDAGLVYWVQDVKPDTLTLDGKDIAVSYAGYPVFHSKIADDAHYLYPYMANFRQHDISVISCHAVKPIPCGEGGVILTNSEYLYKQMYEFVDHGRGTRDSFSYGFNLRMPDINASLGLSQLKRALSDLHTRQSIASFYRDFFKGINAIELPPDHEKHSYHLFVLRLRGVDRDWVIKALRAENIETQIHYPPLYHYPHIEKTQDCPVSEDVWQNGLSIPIFSGMDSKDVQDTIDAVHKVIEYANSHSEHLV